MGSAGKGKRRFVFLSGPFLAAMGYSPHCSRAADSLTWTGAASQGWDTSHANWIDSSGNSAYYANGDSVTFGDLSVGNISITVGNTDTYGGVSPGSVSINNGNTSYTFMYSPIDGTGGLLKTGSGTATLANGPNFYYGSTVISGGTLALQTSGTNVISTSPTIVVGTSGTFDVTQVTGSGSSGVQGFNLSRNQVISGTGTIKGNLVVDSTGTVSPGTFTTLNTGSSTTVGTLNAGNETWDAGGTYAWKISDGSAGAGSGWDDMTMSGLKITASSGSPFTIAAYSLNSTGAIGSPANVTVGAGGGVYKWIIAKSSSLISFNGTTATNGVLSSSLASLFTLNTSNFIENGSSVNPSTLQLELVGDGQNGQDLELDYNSAPEPSTALLALFGSAGMLLSRRRSVRKFSV